MGGRLGCDCVPGIKLIDAHRCSRRCMGVVYRCLTTVSALVSVPCLECSQFEPFLWHMLAASVSGQVRSEYNGARCQYYPSLTLVLS